MLGAGLCHEDMKMYPLVIASPVPVGILWRPQLREEGDACDRKVNESVSERTSE